MKEVENRMVDDSQWSNIEKEGIEKGYFTRLGETFVKEEYLLEVALESVQNDSYYRDSFLEKILDYIESDKEATEKFLKWFYRDYGEDKRYLT